jgi:hypothetical protein
MHPSRNNIGAYIKALACGLASVTAGGSGDNTAVTGATHDRLGYDSVQVAVTAKTTLDTTETLSVALALQESDDGQNWDTAEVIYATTVLKTGGSANDKIAKCSNINLAGRKRYIRFNFTPDLSRANTDTAVVAAVATFGGGQAIPTDLTSLTAL